MTGQPQHLRRWRYYRIEAGKSPVQEQLDKLSDYDLSEITAAMRLVRRIDVARNRVPGRFVYMARDMIGGPHRALERGP